MAMTVDFNAVEQLLYDKRGNNCFKLLAQATKLLLLLAALRFTGSRVLMFPCTAAATTALYFAA